MRPRRTRRPHTRATRNRQPGGRARQGSAFEHQSGTWPMWIGTKKSSSSPGSSPAQMYRPFVPCCRGCRYPLRSQGSLRTFLATPSRESASMGLAETPKRLHTSARDRLSDWSRSQPRSAHTSPPVTRPSTQGGDSTPKDASSPIAGTADSTERAIATTQEWLAVCGANSAFRRTSGSSPQGRLCRWCPAADDP